MYVIIVGAGQVGYYLTKTLLAKGYEVTLVDWNFDKVRRLELELGGNVLYASGSSIDGLEKAGCSRAEARASRCRSPSRAPRGHRNWILKILLADDHAVVREGLLISRRQMLRMAGGGLAGVVFVALGPALAFLLGRLLRNQPNQSVHVLVFALAGAVLGATVGAFFGPDLTMVLAPTMGVAAASARAVMSRWARL